MRTYNLLDKLFSLNYTNQSWREYATNIWESLFNITPVFVVLVYIVFQQYRNEEKKKKIFTPLISRLGYIAEMYRELVEFDVLELSYDNPWLLCRGCRYLESHEDDESHSGYVKRMFKKISSCFACFFRYKAFGFAACQLQLFLQMITETFNWNINESLVLQVLENNQFIAPAVVNTKWFRHNIHYHPHTVNVDDMFPAKNGTKTLLNTSYSDAFLEEFEKDQCKENIKDLYILGPTLGVGAEGHVRLCISSLMAKKYGLNEAQIKWDSLIEMSRSAQQKTGETILYTMKITEKNSCESNIQQVYEDLKNLQHPNVLRVHAFYQDKQNYYLLTDFLEGKELITYLLSSQCNNHAFKENQCRAICFQILKSLEYMHQHNLIHRDVKLENFVCSDPVRMHSFIKQESFRMQDLIDETYFEVPRIVLIDFGLTCRANEACYTRPNGTPLYMAPEVLLQGCSPPFTYQTAVDVWAVGIVLYQLLSGQVPFDAKGPLSFIEKVQTIEYGSK
jgi:tRNA A-37 threonylcarbamoyl transferase component Bud32